MKAASASAVLGTHVSRTGRAASSIERVPSAGILWDDRFRVRSWGPDAEAIFGYAPAEIAGKDALKLLGGSSGGAAALDFIERVVARRAGAKMTMNAWTKAGRLVKCEWTIAPVFGPGGAVQGFAGTVELSRAEDPQSPDGVASRSLFRDRVDRALAACARHLCSAALVAVAVDGGRSGASGNADHRTVRAQIIAGALLSHLRAADAVGVLEDDVLGILMCPVDGEAGAFIAAQRLLSRWTSARPRFERLVPHFGIALYPDDAGDGEALIARAIEAVSQARARELDVLRPCVPVLGAAARTSQTLDLGRALERGLVTLAFEPEVSLRDGSLAGVRARPCWRMTNVLLEGDALADVVRRAGLSAELGAWTISAACAAMRGWQADGVAIPHVRVDVVEGQLQHRLVDDVAQALCDTDIDPGRLELGFASSSLAQGLARIAWLLEELKPLGVRRTIDDVGLDFASLHSLGTLDLDAIGIDRRFVDGCAEHAVHAAAIRSIVDVAHALELDAVADGVETVAQADFLRSAGCDAGRGSFVAQEVNHAPLGRPAAKGIALADIA